MLLLLATMARAGEELDVQAAPSVAVARRAVVAELAAEGFVPLKRVGDYSVFRADGPWKPDVWLHEDGWMSIRRRPPVVYGPLRSIEQGRNVVIAHVALADARPRDDDPAYIAAAAGESMVCLSALTPPIADTREQIPLSVLCTSFGGWFASQRRVLGVTSDVVDATAASVEALSRAVATEAMDGRLDALRGELEALWTRADLAPEARRARVFALWDERTDSEEGARARVVIEDFARDVIQASATPFTTDELAALNAARQAERPFGME